MIRGPLTILVTSTLLFSCSTIDSKNNRNNRRSINVIQSSDIFTLDPHTISETVTHSVLYNVMEPLIRLNSESELDIEGSIAESWVNPNKLTWKFFIRRGIKFHNGKVLTAEDVKASIMRAKYHPSTDVGGGLGNIKSITAEGYYTVVIKMSKASANLPYKLYFCPLMTKEQAERWSEDELNETPVGTGPYRLVSWKKGEQVQLEAFDEYWRGRPPFHTVSFIPETDPQKRVSMLSNGTGDLVLDIPVDMVELVKKLPHVKLMSQESLRVIFLGFDMARSQSPYVESVPSPLLDRRVREAIYRAIDEEKIIREILHGYGQIASQFCSPYVFGFNPKIERLPYDPEGAKKLLEEAGYPDGFSLILHCTNNRYIKDEEIGKTVTEYLRKVGIDAELKAMPKEEFFPLLTEKAFSFFLFGWDCPDGDASSVFFDCLHTSNGDGYGFYNAGGYTNTLLDSLIEMVETTIDPVRRTQLFESAQAIGTSDIPWIPLHIQKNLYGVKKNLSFIPRHDNQISLVELTPEGLL
jgi:peptide/nickel transport system substrate-binding protein